MQQYEAKGILFLQDTSAFTEKCVKKFSNVSRYTESFDNLYRNFIKDSSDFNFDYEFVENGIVKNSNNDDIYPYYKIVVIYTKKRYLFLNIIKEHNTYYINSFYFPRH